MLSFPLLKYFLVVLFCVYFIYFYFLLPKCQHVQYYLSHLLNGIFSITMTKKCIHPHNAHQAVHSIYSVLSNCDKETFNTFGIEIAKRLSSKDWFTSRASAAALVPQLHGGADDTTRSALHEYASLSLSFFFFLSSFFFFLSFFSLSLSLSLSSLLILMSFGCCLGYISLW